MTDERVECPACRLPDQIVGIPCGYCAAIVTGREQTPPVMGWRAWRVIGGLLGSPTYRLTWRPEGDYNNNGWMVAECRRYYHEKHDYKSDDPDLIPPVKGCGGGGHGCGFYCARNHAHLIDLHYAIPGMVIGEVEIAGKVIEATNGWRAQLMRPRKLYVPYEDWKVVKPLEDTYGPFGVSVELAATIIADDSKRTEWCHSCGAKMPKLSHVCAVCNTSHR